MNNQNQQLPNVDLLFPSKYLKAIDCAGQDQVVTITGIEPAHELVMAGGKRERKPVLKLAEIEKLLVLNKTNAYSIADLHGKELQAWIGKQIIIFPDRVKFGRKTVDAIRIRQTAPQPQQAGQIQNYQQQYAQPLTQPPAGMQQPKPQDEEPDIPR